MPYETEEEAFLETEDEMICSECGGDGGGPDAALRCPYCRGTGNNPFRTTEIEPFDSDFEGW